MILDARRTLGPGNASIALRHGADPDVPLIPLSASMRRCRRDKCRAVAGDRLALRHLQRRIPERCRSEGLSFIRVVVGRGRLGRCGRASRVPSHTTISIDARTSPSKPKNENDDATRSRPHGPIDRKPGGSASHRRSDAFVEAAGRAPCGRGGWVWEGGGGNRPSFPWVGVFEGEGQGPSPSWGERERGRHAPFRMR